MRTVKLITLLITAALAVSGCGSGGSKKAASRTIASGAPAQQDLTLPAQDANLSVKPLIPKPQGDPPATLQVRDVVTGKGRAAQSGNNVSVQYVGVAWSTGQEFDSTWSRGKQPFTFNLGAGMVIPGWDQGIVGMKPGGRRLLVIPPSLAYGPQGQPPVIGPNETLVFVVDLQKAG
jgi:peptidylprolyl isomerase